MSSNRKLYLGAIAILLVFLVGGGYWYLTRYRPQQAQREFIVAYQKAHALHDQGKINESIPAFEEALKIAPMKNEAIQTKLKIANDIFSRNQGDDRINAVAMYKEIINDSLVSPFQRMITISDLMDLYNGTQDDNFAQTVIFNGEPFGKFLNEAAALGYGGEPAVLYAERRAYETADQLYPLALAEFRIANWYTVALLGGEMKGKKPQADWITALTKWTEKGEANIPATLRAGYEKSKIVVMYQLDGMARRSMARYGDKHYDLAEAAFKRALQVATEEKSFGTFSLSMFARFHYAAMLAEVYGESRRADIERLLDGIINVPAEFKNSYFVFYDFLKNEAGSEHDSHFHKQDLVRLSKIVPQFRAFLAARGIHY